MKGLDRYGTMLQLTWCFYDQMAGVAYHCEVRLLAEEKIMARDLVVFPVLLMVPFGEGGVLQLGVMVVEVFDVFDDGSGLCVPAISLMNTFLSADFYLPPTT
jgi:hypothetical protein